MKALTIFAALILIGCAHPMANNKDYQDCQYQATLATPGSNSVLADAMRQNDIINMCMARKGYTR